MAKKTIKIDGYIGMWGYGKDMLRYDLEGTQKDGAILAISSLGGSVAHAIDMYNQIAQHGNVEVVFVGPSASAATFLGLAAKSVKIIDNCFFLAHKVMSPIDAWGNYNEEELDALILELSTIKEENKKFDVVIAGIYARRSGKALEDILNLMKQDTWITAQEALTWGFVDEVIAPDAKINIKYERISAMVNSAGLPALPGQPQRSTPPTQINEESLFNRLLAKVTEHFSPQNKKVMKKQFAKVNGVLNVAQLEGDDQGAFLNEAQLEAIENRIAQTDQAVTTANSDRDAAIAARNTANTERDTANTERNAAIAAFDAIDPTIAAAATLADKEAAIRTLLAKKPGVPPAGNQSNGNQPANDGVDWETLNALPHMKDAMKNV